MSGEVGAALARLELAALRRLCARQGLKVEPATLERLLREHGAREALRRVEETQRRRGWLRRLVRAGR